MRTSSTLCRRLVALMATVVCTAAVTVAVTPTPALATGAEWRLDSGANTTVEPGGRMRFTVTIRNVGDVPTAGPAVFTAMLPAGLSVADPSDPQLGPGAAFDALLNSVDPSAGPAKYPCTAPDGSPIAGGEDGVRCEFAQSIPVEKFSNDGLMLSLYVDASPTSSGAVTSRFEIGGGKASGDTTIDPTVITEKRPHFGVGAFDGVFADVNGDAFTQASGHPFEYTTHVDLNTFTSPIPAFADRYPVAPTKDILVDLPPGLLGNVGSMGQCRATELANSSEFIPLPLCPPSSQVGTIKVMHALAHQDGYNKLWVLPLPLFNVAPPVGSPARFGFNIYGTIVFLDVKLRSNGDYGIVVGSSGSPETLAFSGATVNFWGVPADPVHNPERSCPGKRAAGEAGPHCDATEPPIAFLRLPTRCSGPEEITAHADSWENPGRLDELGLPDTSDPAWDTASYVTHEAPGYPASPLDPTTPWGEERGLSGCDNVPVKGTLEAKPTALDTETSTGLQVHVEVPNPGIENPSGIASSDIKAVKVSLPQGVTINPSQAEGLGVCTPSQYESTELSFFPTPGKGCPDQSKIGTVSVKTPLLDETLEGDVYIAQQDDPATSQHGVENPFDSLLALYVVIENPERGILVKLPGRVDLEDPGHPGQIVTSFEDLPQLPFSSFDFKFREGARAPLVTPPQCGTYETEAVFTPWSDPSHTITSRSSFEIVHGLGGGPCPPGGIPPFKPGFSGGTLNNNAASFSPFVMRLTRQDGEQDLTKFSSILPPGVLGKLAGVGKCSEAAIAAAKAKTGRVELASPSCPASSQIGRTLAGAGVGSVLTYVPGKIYLAGPYKGDPLSVVAVTPAVAGPFDVGTVVVREALTLNPETAEVEVDGAASDPIPHVLRGIPLKLRDLRVYVDREDFILNPTSCDPSSVRATLFGSYADVFSPADDVPVGQSDRFQAANCSALGFKPKLSIKLKGGTRRGGHPALRAVLRARPGDANIGAATVTLPRSAFLDQAHIRTICTRVQFAAAGGNGADCPRGARYGYARAFTPLLDEPIEGSVYLRSSNHQLPDLVAALDGLVDVNVVGRIDSFKGGIRSSFESVPDAPVTKFVLTMQGGKKGLVVNSRNLCAGTNRANARFTGQNGKPHRFRPVVRPDCGGKARQKQRRR
jgi:uncharacterized repeat protein (TIGR01451 family)